MMRRFLSPGTAAVALLFSFAMLALPVAAQQAAPAAVPPTPTLPAPLAFAEELAGRRLLFAARDAYRNAATSAFLVRWSVTNTSGTPRARVTKLGGTEAVFGKPAERKLSLAYEAIQEGGTRTVRRAVASGQEMLVTRFEQKTSAKDNPTREFFRIPLDEGVTLTRALQQAQFAPSSRAGQFLLDTDVLGYGRTIWRTGRQSVDGKPAEAVCEIEAAGSRRETTTTARTRRYLIDPSTHLLRRYEEWTVIQSPQRRAGSTAPRVAYRREDYTATRPTSAVWSQTLPPGYRETALPDVRLPALPPPPGEQIAPKAIALVQRWRNAQERFLTYSAEVQVEFRAQARTPDARPLPEPWLGSSSLYRVNIRRPARTRVEITAVQKGGAPGVPASLVAVSDGSQVRVNDTQRRTSRTVDIANTASLWPSLTRAGMEDPWQSLVFLYNAPPAATSYESATYDGPAVTADGEPVEVVTLTRSTSNTDRRGRLTETKFMTRVALGRDGLPREITQVRTSDVSGGLLRDQSPIITVTNRYRNVRVDTDPVAAFVLPAELARQR